MTERINNNYQFLRDQQEDLRKEQERQRSQFEGELQGEASMDNALADGLSNLAGSFSNYGTDSIAKTGLNGLSMGMKYGSMANQSEKRKKFFEVMRSFEENNNSIKEKLAKARLNKEAKERVQPYMSAYLKNMGKMSEAEQKKHAQKIMDISNRILGEESKLLSIDNENRALWSIQDAQSGQALVIDMGIAFAGDQAAELEYAQYQTSNIDKRQVDQQEKDRKAQLEYEQFKQKERLEDNKLAHQKSKFGYESNPVKQGEAAFLKAKQKTLGENVFKYKQSLNSTQNIMDRLQRMDAVVKNNFWLFDLKPRNLAKWLTINPENGLMSFKEEYARFSLDYDNSRVEVIKKLSKEYNNILYDKVNRQSVGRVTDKMLAMDQKGLPLPWEMSKEAYFETIKELTTEYNNEAVQFSEEIMRSDDQFKRLSGGGMMKFLDGSSRFVPSDEIEVAEKLGAKHE